MMAVDQERPVFLLGTGRCGSTSVQREFCLNSNLWLWGEHDGILRGLHDWIQRARNNRTIADFCFRRDDRSVEDIVAATDRDADNDIAWLNRFRADAFDDVWREAIRRLFATSLPAGKTRWGFKEIRYGPDDRVAEALLAAFPKSSIVHLVRSPAATIESSMIAWRRQAVADFIANDDIAGVDGVYREFAARWALVTQYYLDLEAANPTRVKTVAVEQFARSKAALAEFLGIEFLCGPPGEPGKINGAAHLADREMTATLARLREKHAAQVSDVARRCGYAA
jgi:hypothetical protein